MAENEKRQFSLGLVLGLVSTIALICGLFRFGYVHSQPVCYILGTAALWVVLGGVIGFVRGGQSGMTSGMEAAGCLAWILLTACMILWLVN